ncbi:MAG: peptidoglycan-binding domain-containing protein [Candidatus Nomurabacteria bacterium]|nr:peptidoglycan-binding domain-containing protein [Candidatus Nomurabacteria bacterium]
MKKVLLSLFIFGFLTIGTQAHAFSLSDAQLEIQNLKNDILQLKGQLLGAAAFSNVSVSKVAPKTTVGDQTPRIKIINKVGGIISSSAEFNLQWSTVGFTSTDTVHLSISDANNNYPFSISTLNDGNETIVIPPLNGTYTFIAKIDGTNVSASDEFNVGLIITTGKVAPKTGELQEFKIKSLTPVSGGTYFSNSELNVTWSTNGFAATELVNIAIAGPNGTYPFSISTVNDGNETIFIPSVTNGTYEFVLKINSYHAASNEFNINLVAPTTTTPSIKVLAPNGGEIYQTGQQVVVKWETHNCTGNITEINLIPIDMQGGSGVTFVKDIPNTGSYTVTLPTAQDGISSHYSFGNNFKMQVMIGGSQSNNEVTDSSDNLFTISIPIITPVETEAKVAVKSVDQLSPISRTLKVGIKGEDVKRLQSFLKITPDGSFGPMTAIKVKEWQAANGLKQDGLFGIMSSQKAGLDK